MHGWLIYDREGAKKNSDYITYHHEVGARYGISFRLVYTDELSALLQSENASPDFAIVRTIRPAINALLEARGIPVFNNSEVSYIANHKGRCIGFIFENTTIPTIPTTVLSEAEGGVLLSSPNADPDGSVFLSYDEAVSLLRKKEGYVLKPATGHGGAGVRRIPAEGLSEDCLRSELSQDDLILQPFIEGPGEDVRVYVIGNRIVGAVRRHAGEGEFRANASLGGRVSRYALNDIETKQVQTILGLLDFGMVGIDFIIDNNGAFVFSEIEDVVGARMLYRACPEIDILDEYLRFIKTKTEDDDVTLESIAEKHAYGSRTSLL